MYPISQTALNKFQSGAMQYARITIGNTTITNANIVQGGMSINRYCSTGESVTVGSCVAAELSLTLANRDGSWNSFSFDGKEAYVEVGVYTSTSTITYIPMGYFVIDEVKFDRNTVTLTALDRLVKFDGAIDATQFTFPYTLKTLLARLCAICGVTLGTTGNFTNYSYSVAALPGEAKTYRDVLRWICELSGTNGYIKYDGKLYIEWYSTTSGFTVTTANRTQSEVDENTFSLTGVTLIQDETRYSAGTSVRPIIIQDNPLVSNNPQTLVNNLNTKLNGFSWCPFNAITLPAPHLYPMDRCTFTKKDGTNVAVSITGVTYKLNGNTSIVGGGDAKHKGRSYGLQDATFYAANIAAGAITADKIAAGAISADKIATGTITVGNMSADAQSEMLNSNIVVGGRNLALRTATMPTSGTPRWVMSVAGTLSTVALSDAPISGLTNAIRVTNETSSAARCGFCGSNTSGFVVGKQYTIGCWIRASVAGLTINLRAVWNSESYTAMSNDNTTTTDWQYVKFEGATLTGTQVALYAPALIHVVSLPSNGWFEVCGIKLEEGNKASAWTPAPEDVEAENAATYATQTAASSQTQRVYYRTSSSTAPTASSTWVTSTSTENNTWSTKRMQYDSTYKYLWTCLQTKSVSGSVTNSTVLLDDTTTVIDGGNIITGSVDTNQLNASAVTAAKIASGAVTAEKISVSDLSAIQGATIAGWSMDSTRIYKEVTIDGYVYQVLLYAPATPDAGNIAVGVRKRPVDSQTWSYPCYFNYGGTLTANDAVVRGTVVASDFTANGKVRIAPDYDLQEAGVYAFELVDQDGYSTIINPDFADFAMADGWLGTHIDGSYVTVKNGTTPTSSDYTEVNLENLGAGYTGVRVCEGQAGSSGYKESFLGADQLVVNGKNIFADHTKVKQTVTTTSADYPILFGATAITQNTQASTVTDESRISGGIFINPNTATINARRIHTGTTSQYGRIVLGNNIPNGTAGCSHGEMYIYCKGSTYVRIADVDGVINANRTYRLPNQSGYLVVDAVTSGSLTGTSNVSSADCTWTKTGRMVRLSGTFYFSTSTSVGTLFTGLPVPASEMTINVLGQDNHGSSHEQLCINTSGEIEFNSTGTHSVDQSSRFQFDTTYIAASL